MDFRDSAGRKIGYVPIDMRANQTSPTLVFQVTPDSDSFLASSVDANLQIQARKAGTSDPFVDISTPLDLSGETPDVPVDYDFRFVTGSFSGYIRVAPWFGVEKSGSADW